MTNAIRYGRRAFVAKRIHSFFSSSVATVVPHTNPFGINNLVAWYKSDTGVTASGVAVEEWADQSGNGNHLFALSGNLRTPQISYVSAAADFNNLPVIDFSQTWGGGNLTTDGCLATTGALNPSGFTSDGFTMFCVASYDGIAGGTPPKLFPNRYVVFVGTGSAEWSGLRSGPPTGSNPLLDSYYTRAETAAATIVSGATNSISDGPENGLITGVPTVMGTYYVTGASPTTVFVMTNGVVDAREEGTVGGNYLGTTYDGYTFDPTSKIAIGGIATLPYAEFGMDGKIAEAVIFDRCLTEHERGQLAQYFYERYNIEGA